MTEDNIKRGFYPENLDINNYHYYIPRRAILDFIQSNSSLFDGVFVDLGCGFMPYKSIIVPKVNKYVPIDFENSEIYSGEGITFWDGCTIPLEDNSVDLLLASELLEHVEKPRDIAHEVGRVLKPGGLWLGTVPFIWPMHEVPHDHARYTPYALSSMLNDADFSINSITALGGIDTALAQMLGIWRHAKTHKKTGRKSKIGDAIIVRLMKILISRDQGCEDVFSNNNMFTGLGWVAKKN